MEIGIQNYIDFLLNNEKNISLSGLAINHNGKILKSSEIEYLPSDKWSYPAIEDLPLEELFLSQKARELSINVIRGCYYNCSFCYTPLIGKERHINISNTVDFISSVQERFDTLHFYGSNFTRKRSWTIDFCKALKDVHIRLPWRCTTRYNLLDEELIKIMASAGCKGIGMGIETLSHALQKEISKIIDYGELIRLCKIMQQVGISPKAFIMIGIPGQTKDDVYSTIALLYKHNISIRPSTFVPYSLLRDKNDYSHSWHRHSYIENASKVTGISKSEVLKIIYNRDIEFERIYREFKDVR